MKIEMAKTYRYRNGAPARVLCVDRPNANQPVITLTESGELKMHNTDGAWYMQRQESGWDLIEAEPKCLRCGDIKTVADAPPPYNEMPMPGLKLECQDRGRTIPNEPPKPGYKCARCKDTKVIEETWSSGEGRYSTQETCSSCVRTFYRRKWAIGISGRLFTEIQWEPTKELFDQGWGDNEKSDEWETYTI